MLSRITRGGATNTDAATGLLLAGFLALGSVLASDVYRSGVGVDRLLFGTLLGLGDGDVLLAAGVAAAAAAATAALARTWLATGFDPGGARALGIAAARGDWLLLALLATTVVAVLPAVGALLVSTLLVVPAATARLLTGLAAGAARDLGRAGGQPRASPACCSRTTSTFRPARRSRSSAARPSRSPRWRRRHHGARRAAA